MDEIGIERKEDTPTQHTERASTLPSRASGSWGKMLHLFLPHFPRNLSWKSASL
jgi:hypothetical protein